jgi:methionyl-tRNA formyltransferase
MKQRFIFVGNRRFVLEQMLEAGINIEKVIVIGGTHLEKDFQNGLLSLAKNVFVIHNKSELINIIDETQFDILISNGCPYIFPTSILPTVKFVNIHPSFLPDLKGADPAIGAILHQRDAGATCHLMDSGIDTGPVIAQVRIPYSVDLDVTTLYQLSFHAEKKVFSMALQTNFETSHVQMKAPDSIYYNRKPEDRLITFCEENDFIFQKIRAFNNKSQGCEFAVHGVNHKVFSASRMINQYLFDVVSNYPDCVVALSYENCVIFRKDSELLRFESIVSPEDHPITVGDKLG